MFAKKPTAALPHSHDGLPSLAWLCQGRQPLFRAPRPKAQVWALPGCAPARLLAYGGRPAPASLRQRLLAARQEGCVLAALAWPRARGLALPSPALPICDGRLLQLALLPLILDRELPGWRQQGLRLYVADGFAGHAALRLAEETDRLSLWGPLARPVVARLYAERGLIAEARPAGCQADLSQPRFACGDLRINEQTLAPEAAQALLVWDRLPQRPDPAYLRALGCRAEGAGVAIM